MRKLVLAAAGLLGLATASTTPASAGGLLLSRPEVAEASVVHKVGHKSHHHDRYCHHRHLSWRGATYTPYPRVLYYVPRAYYVPHYIYRPVYYSGWTYPYSGYYYVADRHYDYSRWGRW